MADETNTNTTAAGASSSAPTTTAPAGTTPPAPPAQDEPDGDVKLDAAEGPKISAAQAEDIRRKAYERATGKDQGGSTDGQDKAADDDDDPEFDQDNGVDADGEPLRKPAAPPASPSTDKAAKPPAAPAKPAHAPPATPEARADLVKATRSLRLDGYSDEDLAELSPAATIRLGKLANERHTRTAAALRQAAEIRKGAATATQAPNTAGAGHGARRTSQTTTATDGQRAPQADRLDALLAELEGETPPETDPAADNPKSNEEAENLRRERDEYRDRLVAAQLDRGVRSLFGEFPALRGEKAKSAVVARMDALDPQGKAIEDYQSLVQLIRDAAYIEFGPELSEQARLARKEKSRMQREGQPDAAGDNREPAKKVSKEDLRRAAYETARAGTPEEARRAFRNKLGAA